MEITQEDVEEYFERNSTDIQEKFNFKLEKIKKQLHKDMTILFNQFPNAKNFKIDFDYDWSIECSSWINTDDRGWYNHIVNKTKNKLDVEQKGDEQ